MFPPTTNAEVELHCNHTTILTLRCYVLATTASPLDFDRLCAANHVSEAPFGGLDIFLVVVIIISNAEPAIAASLHQRQVLRLLGEVPGHLQVEEDDEDHGAGEVPAELQVDKRLGAVERVVGAAPDDVVPFLEVEEAPLGYERGRPEHDAHDDEPDALEHEARGPDQAHDEAPRAGDPEQRGGERDGDDGLQQPVELALHAHVVRRVEVEDEQLLRERRRGHELRHGVPQGRPRPVEVDGDGREHQQRQRDGRVLEVVEVVGRDGPVVVERLVLRGADDQLHQDGGHRADDYEDELEVAHAAHREPDGRRVRARAQQEEAGVAEQLPQADEEEAGARRDVPDESAHGARA
ncbi:hypothetical protein BS78_02G198200 [Paspalum vaginatum]|nr:hypothetical protein BS78_02G198200 [Paspalum vaginatum]